MTQPERVYVALGSNLGDRVGHLAHARLRLAALPGTTLVAASGLGDLERATRDLEEVASRLRELTRGFASLD